MKVIRARSFEDKEGNWHKFEIELSDDDLTLEERESPNTAWPMLLQLRAEKYIITSLLEMGFMDVNKASEEIGYLSELSSRLIATPSLKMNRNVN